MPLDDDADDDVGGFDPPLPPDDRLWRHPSELASVGPASATSPARGPTTDRRSPAWPIAAVAGLVGAALSTAVLAVTGAFSTEVTERQVIEKIAVAPVVTSPMLNDEQTVAAVADQVAPAVVRLVVATSEGMTAGSGVLFRSDGLLLTSARLLAGASTIDVALADGRRFEGNLVGTDPTTDVALVRVDGDRLPVAVLGSSADLEAGTTTIAVGCARADDHQAFVSTGVISAVERRVDAGDAALHGMIQTDTPIDLTGTGGPLVDTSGTVIGIVTSVDGADGFHFAVPIDLARRVAGQLMTSGRAIHGWLGIEGTDLSPEQARSMGIDGGALVRGVEGDSPAALGGLAADDVITEVDGTTVDSASELVVLVRDHQPGDALVLGFWRAGERLEASVTASERP